MSARDQTMQMLETLAVAGLGKPLEPCEIVREIVAGDLPLLAQEKREHNWATDSPEKILTALRTGHHKLAQLLASGVSVTDASMMTGRSPTSISTLQKDPAFVDLLAYYADQQAGRDFEAYDRLVALGGTAMDVLQERLEERPDVFSNNELRQIMESTMDRSAAPAKGDPRSGQGKQAGLSVNINFVPAQPTGPVLENDGASAPVIEVLQIEEKDDHA